MAVRLRPAVSAAALLLATGCTSSAQRPAASLPHATAPSSPSAAPTGSAADHVTGDHWRLTKTGPQDAVEGYADATDVTPGQPVRLFVSTTARSFTVTAFRTGWYGGVGARRVWRSGRVRGVRQPHPGPAGPRRTVEARWRPSLTVRTDGWAPGDYLFRLQSSAGYQSYVPLTLRSPSVRGTVVLLNGVTTWQAYNTWGCCSLYAGFSGFADRARAVSFDRPYVDEHGSGRFQWGELPAVAEAERVGQHHPSLRLSYLTDVDLQRDPHALDGARAVFSLGHDEYWSPEMRAALTRARDAGTNLAFLGANAIFRRIRLAATPLGPDRLEINYKVASEDPVSRTDPVHSTANWPAPPAADPESSLIGEQYACLLTPRYTNAVVADPSSWLLRGIPGVRRGGRLPGLLGPEVDAVQRGYPMPRGVRVLLHSPVPCPGGVPSHADATYYVAPSGAGVFASGTMRWPCALQRRCTGSATTARFVRSVTDRLLLAFAAGPVSPSRGRAAATRSPGTGP